MDIGKNSAATESMDQSPGSILRRCRENLEIPIEQAAEATKIRKAYLAAMEADNLKILPSQSYYRGFLRTYSTYLGLDTEALLRLSERQKTSCFEKTSPGSEKAVKQSIFPWQQMILPAILLAGIIISTIFVKTDQPPPARRPEPPKPVPAAVPMQVPVQQQSSSVKENPAEPAPPVKAESAPSDEQTAAPLPPPQMQPGSFLVRMRVTKNSSLTVIIDESTSQLYELTSGDIIEWKAGKTVAMDISDAGSVEVELNGKPLKLESAAGKSAYIVLDANGIQR